MWWLMTEPFKMIFVNFMMYDLLPVSSVFNVWILYEIKLCSIMPIIRMINFTTTWAFGYLKKAYSFPFFLSCLNTLLDSWWMF